MTHNDEIMSGMTLAQVNAVRRKNPSAHIRLLKRRYFGTEVMEIVAFWKIFLPAGLRKLNEMVFIPCQRFRKKYKKLFKKDPEAANLFLLLCELADEKGQVETSDEELAELMQARFNDPTEHAFRGNK